MNIFPKSRRVSRVAKTVLGAATASLLLAACTTTPTGRRVMTLFPESYMSGMGATAYADMKTKQKVSKSTKDNGYAQCIANAIIQVLPAEYAAQDWEVTVFDDDAANAFALPGGKIGVYEGLFKVAVNQNQVAAVMGHEVAHVIAQHSNARMSTAFGLEQGLQIAGAFISKTQMPSFQQQGVMQVLGLGAQVGVLLPFSRGDESESDILGLQYMARAGFDPRESVKLWQNMAKASDGQPPEFMSTHPSHDRRISDLQANMQPAMVEYERARRAGRKPNCRR